MSPRDEVLLAVFHTFHTVGQILLILYLFTVAAARLSRDLALLNVIISMTMYSTACLLLLYSRNDTDRPPTFSLCIAQACLMYGSLSMGAAGILCLFYQLWSGLRSVVNGAGSSLRCVRKRLVQILPWLVFLGMFMTALIDGLRNKSEVNISRDFFYCSASSVTGYTSTIVCGLLMLVSVVLELHVAYLLFLSWRSGTLQTRALPMDLIVRLGVFSIYGILCVVVAIILASGSTPKDKPSYAFLFMSTLPLAIWAVFGTQKDVFRAWTFQVTRASGISEGSTPSMAQSKMEGSVTPFTT